MNTKHVRISVPKLLHFLRPFQLNRDAKVGAFLSKKGFCSPEVQWSQFLSVRAHSDSLLPVYALTAKVWAIYKPILRT